MTPTSIQNNGFEQPLAHMLSRDDIAELTEKLITSFLDSLHILRLRNKESEDAINAQSKITSMLVNNNIRELTEADIKVIGTEVKASQVLTWMFSRMLSSTRALSINPKNVDMFIASALSFYPLSKFDNEYAAEHTLNSESAFIGVYNKYPYMKILALFEILNIFQEMEYRKAEAETAHGS